MAAIPNITYQGQYKQRPSDTDLAQQLLDTFQCSLLFPLTQQDPVLRTHSYTEIRLFWTGNEVSKQECSLRNTEFKPCSAPVVEGENVLKVIQHKHMQVHTL